MDRGPTATFNRGLVEFWHSTWVARQPSAVLSSAAERPVLQVAERPSQMTPAIAYLESEGIAFKVHEFDSSQSHGYGAEAARALGLPAERVFKTLVAKVDAKRLVVAVLPVDRELNLKLLAAAADGKRAAMASAREAERATGYVLGGISPLGQRQALATVLDASALEHATIFVSGGRRGLELELSGSVLQSVCRAKVSSIARTKSAA